MKRRHFLAGLPAAVLAGGCWGAAHSEQEPISDPRVERYREEAVEQWEATIQRLEARDEAETHPADSILFVGSSSIRLWADIAADMAPYHPIRRGYGGARWSDVAVFAERLIEPHTFRAVVFFVGNDITGRAVDKSPEEVARLFEYVLGVVRAHNATAPVFHVAVTPTASRFAVWPQIKAANRAVQAVCDAADDTYFIGTESIYLDGEGQPHAELFLGDRLHLNREGYIRWAAAIKSHLDTVLGGAS